MITTGQKSRKAEPFELLNAVTERDSMIAERHLLRSLLKRCDAILRDVAIICISPAEGRRRSDRIG